MKKKIIAIFVNAVVGATASALSIWLGASAGEAVVVGASGSGLLGESLKNVVTAALATVQI